jgi:GDPmannose 4,6-dehydratase
LGNIDAKRDWGHAKDYIEAMYLMLQQETPDDYVLATGLTTSVRDFLILAFSELGVKLEFEGEGVNEIGKVKSLNNKNIKLPVGKIVLKIDPKYYRPTEVDLLIGDASKAMDKLGWKPKYDLKALVKEMIQADYDLFKRDKYLLRGGHKILNYHE